MPFSHWGLERACNTHDPRRPKTNCSFASFLSTPFLLDNARALACAHEGHIVAKWNACEFDFFRCRLCDSRRVVYKQRCGWRTKRVRSEFLHSNREGVERFDVWKKRDAQGSLRWMWKGMWSPIQARWQQTCVLPRVLREESPPKKKSILDQTGSSNLRVVLS